MTHDRTPHHEVDVYCSSDPAIDREAMGADFARHFGDSTLDGEMIRMGSRDPALLKFRADETASRFTIRALTMQESRSCKAPAHFADRCLRAFMFAIVKADLVPPLAHTPTLWQPSRASGQAFLEPAQLDSIAQIVGDETCVEIGSVALQRMALRPFSVPHYLLPADSVLAQMRTLQLRADILVQEKFDTKDTGEP